MRLDHEERKAKADEKAAPEFCYSYVLRFEDDGSFYVGSTNNPAARFTEHAVGVGAVVTSGRRFTVCLVHQFGSRTEAEYEEEDYEREMQSVFHHSTALSWNPGGRPPTTCGYDGMEYYSTQSWDTLIQQAREEDALRAVGGQRQGREVCRQCLALVHEAATG